MTKFTRRQINTGAAALGAGLAMPSLVRADTYPSQDIHLICAFPAGSGADVIVRWYGEKLRAVANRTVIVENRVGALGNLGAEYMVRSKPDGYTIYVHGGSGVSANMSILKHPTFDAAKAIRVAATINRQPTMMVVAPNKPWKSVAEVTAYVKEKKDKATYATTNPLGKVMGAIYKTHYQLEPVEVQYRTANDCLNDLTSGTVDYAMLDNIFSAAQAREGRVRILAVSTKERLQANPDIPTMTELGCPMNVTGWFAAMVPMATPRPIVDEIARMFNQITKSPEAKAFLNSVASDPWVTTTDEAQAFLNEEIKNWAGYVKLAKIEPQG
jgi:tripartite-type tricarboxylate transporter receptor subunit TctC